MLVGVVAGYRRQAYANCVSVGAPNIECSGVSLAQGISATNAHVTALAGFSVTTGAVNALTIMGAGDISYTDVNASPLTTTAAARTGLYVRSYSGSPGSLTISTNGAITGGSFGITGLNRGTGGALTVTANGDVTGTGATSRGIFTVNSGTDHNVTTGSGASVAGGLYGIFARNYGTGATNITVNGDVTTVGTSGSAGILVRSDVGTSVTVTTGAGTAVTGRRYGIFARNGGSGALTITTSGDVTGTLGNGIYARHAGGGPIAITVNSGSQVNSSGTGSTNAAISTQGGPTTLTVGGTLTGSTGGAVRFDQFSALADRVVLQPTALVTGNVLAGLGTDTLVLGGAGMASFNVATVGAGLQYQSFETFQKDGTSQWTLSGTNIVIPSFAVNGGELAVNATMANTAFTVNSGTLSGTGTLGSLTMMTGSIVAPGNSIGTLTVNGNFVQNAGTTYQVEVNAAGQSDRINVSGMATINGGTVQVLAQSGSYGRNTTYTIVNATGGLSGVYSNVTSNFAFLTPSLSYDANNVYLLLFQSANAFAAGAQTSNQYAVGSALDIANRNATGDFNTFLNALSALDTVQGPVALDAISGQQYSAFGTANVTSSLAFMNMLGQQMSLARGGNGSGNRVALAQACDVACDGAAASPWSLWGGALGAAGSVVGNGNSSTLTYNLGGFAGGIDYRLDPQFLIGVGLGYSSGIQWVSGFYGRGTSDSYNAAVYASFTQSAFYIDALAGYGYNDNRMQRQIAIPGLAPRNAQGRTSANQFIGQAEAGYRSGIYEPADISVTPFARFQTISVNQNGLSESGANSLNLNVAQQTTTSMRSVLGTELSGTIDMAWREKLALQLRLGWAHEYADTSRPVTASFAGTPGIGYTIYGAAPQRDAAVIGFAANTAVTSNASFYLRYDGEIGGGTGSHVLSAGFRMTW